MTQRTKIHIPTPLRPYVDGLAVVEVEGTTVGEALNALVALHPGLTRHLQDEQGRLRRYVNVYRNDEDVRHLEREGTALVSGDTLSIVPSIAGGVDPPAWATGPTGGRPRGTSSCATAGASPARWGSTGAQAQGVRRADRRHRRSARRWHSPGGGRGGSASAWSTTAWTSNLAPDLCGVSRRRTWLRGGARARRSTPASMSSSTRTSSPARSALDISLPTWSRTAPTA
jgi:adenylyltransferase/sulfurtransferase